MTGRSRFLECAGFDIHFTDWGPDDAPPAILWHGLARTVRDFDDIAGALSDSYRCIGPDTIGRGMSQWAKDPARDYCFARYGETAVALIDQLGFDTVRWIGTSMSRLIGITLAAGALAGIVRAKSITLPERQTRISSPLISLDFSGSIRAVRGMIQIFRILL